MSQIFAGCRGAVYTPLNAGGGGWYKLDGLTSTPTSPVLIQGAQLTDSDLVLPVTALGNIKILYAFGQRFGDVQIIGNVLAGPVAGDGAVFNVVYQFFQDHRVTKLKDSVKLSIPGGKAYKIYIVGLGLAEPDPQYHVQPFLLHGMVAGASDGF